jgi:hypothetical protein
MAGLNRSICPCLVPRIYLGPNATVYVRLQLCPTKALEIPLLVLTFSLVRAVPRQATELAWTYGLRSGPRCCLKSPTDPTCTMASSTSARSSEFRTCSVCLGCRIYILEICRLCLGAQLSDSVQEQPFKNSFFVPKFLWGREFLAPVSQNTLFMSLVPWGVPIKRCWGTSLSLDNLFSLLSACVVGKFWPRPSRTSYKAHPLV